MAQVLDLGSGHTLQFAVWDPDLALNPQCREFAAELPATVCGIVRHLLPDGSSPCEGVITFDVPAAHHMKGSGPFWTVESWDPLTISPSLLCHCGDHGHIREGKWVPAG